MKIALLQMDIAWGNPKENVQRAEILRAAQAGADLYVLPEMWATGFATQPKGLAERESASLALDWMQKTARAHSCAVCGSLAVEVQDSCVPSGFSYRNRHYFVTPDGIYYYDKHHLFTHGHEDEAYTAGQKHTVVSWKGFRFLLLTCYDLRFPVWARYGWAGEYDAIIYVANWPQTRMNAWDVLVHARAIENQCYVIAVNRVGQDSACQYTGGSMVVDPIGRTMAVGRDKAEQSLTAVLSFENLQKARSHFKVLQDEDMPQDLFACQ